MLRHTVRFAVLPLLAFYVYLAGSAPFLGQWDSYDYLKQIVTHQFSDLGIGRPVFVGYNIALWELMRKLLALDTLRVEAVVMLGVVLFGALGVLIYQRLAQNILSSPASHMAAIALALSPLYAMYSGFIMTEVPMLALLMASALILWKGGTSVSLGRDVAGGVLFGLAVGMREQALTLGAAYVWILWCRQSTAPDRIRSISAFGLAAAALAVAPAVGFYLHDAALFMDRLRTWIGILPTGSGQFRTNAEASLLFAVAICPGAWLALAGAGVCRLFRKRRGTLVDSAPAMRQIPHPVWGFLCCIALPMLILWRDADVQLHPRYLLILLPASALFCASLFRRWVPSRKGLIAWGVMQVLCFGLALMALSPYRRAQTEKMEFARIIRTRIPGAGLMIGGNLSPLLDYYRGIGVRPEWQIQWSGWDWNIETVDARIREAWALGLPVYLSTQPSGWSYFERELLEVHHRLKDCRRERLAPHLYRIYPR